MKGEKSEKHEHDGRKEAGKRAGSIGEEAYVR